LVVKVAARRRAIWLILIGLFLCQAPTNGNVVKDLLSLDDDDTPRAAGPASAPDLADDLLGGLSGPGQPGAGASGNALDLLSLLDDSAPVATTSGALPPQQQPLVRVQLL
jgi:hypothetical protein